MGTSNQSTGISLGNETRWVVTGLCQIEPFFRHLGRLIPTPHAIVYLEGTSISTDVRAFLARHSVPAWHEVLRGTIWPQPSTFHLPISQEVLNGLAELAMHHAYPEIA